MGREYNKYKNVKKENIRMAILILLIGILVSGALFLKEKKTDNDGSVIEREYGKNRDVKLIADSVYGKEVIEMEVLSRTYSDEEINAMITGFEEELKQQILGSNQAFNSVNSDLVLEDRVSDYPFEIEYRIRPRGYIDSSGKIISDIHEETDLNIEIKYYLDDYENELIIPMTIVPREFSENEIFYERLKQKLDENNSNLRTSELMELPNDLDGISLSWEKPKKKTALKVVALTGLLALIVLFKDRLTAGENMKKRKQLNESEYPEFAMKYALLCEAGLTHRQIVERMGDDFKNKREKGPIYEELYRSSKRLKAGISLTDSLNEMASDCGVRELSYFVSLINRNIKKGGREIAAEIRKAADESISQKREKIRRKAETAGTKLLLPMALMMVIVFVLIMIPAFESFSF